MGYLRHQSNNEVTLELDYRDAYECCVQAANIIGSITQNNENLGFLTVKLPLSLLPLRNPVTLRVTVKKYDDGCLIVCNSDSFDGSIGFGSAGKAIDEFFNTLSSLVVTKINVLNKSLNSNGEVNKDAISNVEDELLKTGSTEVDEKSLDRQMDSKLMTDEIIMQRTYKIIGGVIALLILFGLFTSCGDDSNNNANISDSSSTSTDISTSNSSNSSISEDIKNDNTNDTMIGSNVSATSSTKIGSYSTENQYITIKITISNPTNEPIHIDSDNFALFDSNGNKYDPNSDLNIWENDNSFSFETINPGLSKSGAVIFEVPTGISELTLGLRDNIFDFAGVNYNYYKLEIK